MVLINKYELYYLNYYHESRNIINKQNLSNYHIIYILSKIIISFLLFVIS